MKIDLALVSPPLKAILGQYLRTAKVILAIVVVLTILGSLTGITAPFLFSRLIDQLDPANLSEGLIWGFVAYAVLMGASYTIQRMSSFLTFMTSESLNFVTSTAFFERIAGKASGFFLDHNPVEIETAQHRGLESLNIVVQFTLAALLPGTLQVALSLIMLGTVLSPDIALIVVVYGVVHIWLVARATRTTRVHLDEAIEHSQASSRFIGNAISSMDTLRQFGSARWMIGQFTRREQSAHSAWQRYAMAHVRYAGLFGASLAIQFALTLWLLVPRVAEGSLTVGDLVLFNTLLLQLNMPFQMMGQAIQQMSQSYSKFLPFARMWQAEAHDDFETTGDFSLDGGAVTFSDVGYVYPNGRGVSGASFEARRGTITYITGDTGSGKSTLFKLLLKSMEPQTGTISIDGTSIGNVSRADWFAQVAAVPQDVVLLNDTLATNIVLGRFHDDARLRRAAERAAVLGFIEGLDDGFETVVGERGLKLSGGERQRIAIARALYADPAILLLDEASSSLDAETEKDIMDQLRHIRDQVTIIAITHRLSVIEPEDTVVRIGPATESAATP